MLYPVSVKKITLVFHKNRQEEVIAALHEAGVLQLKKASLGEETRKQIGQQLDALQILESKLREIEELFQTPVKRPVAVKDLSLRETLRLAERVLKRIEPKIKKYKQALDQLQQEIQNVERQISILTPFSPLPFPLERLSSGRVFHVAVGFIDHDRFEEFRNAARTTFEDRVVVQAVGVTKRLPIIVVCMEGEKRKLAPLLYRFGVEPVDLPAVKETPQTAIIRLQTRLARLKRKRERIERSLRELGRRYARTVSSARELLDIQRERLDAVKFFGETDATIVLEGWVPSDDLPKVERVIQRVTKGRYMMLVNDPSPAEAPQVPIRLRNPKLVKDFEFLTGMYGLPRYTEIDPTLFLSVTFPIFFGICLSDAGYGLVLAIFMLSGAWFAKSFPPHLRRTMALCGIVTAVVSIFIGGWFGFGGGAWANPIKSPIPVLKLVVFIGLCHLVLAFGVAGVLKDLRRKALFSVVTERLSKILILMGFFGLAFSVLGVGLYEFGIEYSFPQMELFSAFNPLVQAPLVTQISRVMFYGGLALGIAGAAISAPGIRGKIGGAINTVYGITGLIADVTSYTRLLALGIATGVIGFSINLIISIFWKWLVAPNLSLSPYLIIAALSAVALGLVFVAGHSFNIFINTLGGFIHTMRLHFAEFFGKFYEGGGEPFRPFKAKRKFTILKGGVRGVG